MIPHLPPSLLTSAARELSNHLWQSTLFAGVVALLALALRKYPARARYWLWLAASAKFLIPFSLLIAAGTHLARPTHPSPTQTTTYLAIDEMSQPFTAPPTFASPIPIAAPPTPTHRLSLPAALTTLWLIGFLATLTSWLIQWRRVALTLRNATPLHSGRVLETLRRIEAALNPQPAARNPQPVALNHAVISTGAQPSGDPSNHAVISTEAQRSGETPASAFAPATASTKPPIPIFSSTSTMEPGIFGILRPVLLWPADLSSHLDDAHLEAVLAHEAAHVRRRDNLTSLLHMLVEALFWFHPLVWWIETQLVKERERACDEEVLLLCHQPQVYAESILKVCELCLESPLTCVSGITGADLKQRIVQIMTYPIARKLGPAAKLLLAVAALLAIAVPILSGQAEGVERQLSAMALSQSSIAKILPALQAPIQSAPTAPNAPADPTTDTAEPKIGPPFEVATIRPADPKDGRHFYGIQPTPSGRLTASASTLSSLVWYAYVIPAQGQVTGGPDWVGTDSFDINAKIDDSAMEGWDKLSEEQRRERVKPMLRALLADRFHLKLRTEIRQTQVYALTQAKGGIKMKAVDPPSGPDLSIQDQMKKMKEEPNKALPGHTLMTGDMWYGSAIKVSSMTGQIQGNARLDASVVDETGLTGYYDFAMHLSHDEDGPTFQDQIEQQLGLKLVPKKIPMKTYVIESAEKPTVDGAEVSNSSPNSSAAVGSQPPPVGRMGADAHPSSQWRPSSRTIQVRNAKASMR